MPDHTLRILIVEDQLLVAKQLDIIASSAGHVTVGAATTAQEACALVRRVDPDVVFIDVNLAGQGSGLDVARYVADHSGALAVFTTANKRRIPNDYSGAIGVVEKPFNRAGLSSALRYIADRMRNVEGVPRKPGSLQLSPAYEHRWCRSGAGHAAG